MFLLYKVRIFTITIGHVNEYPTMHYFRIPRHTQSMITYKILTEYFWKFQWKLHCGIFINMPYSHTAYHEKIRGHSQDSGHKAIDIAFCVMTVIDHHHYSCSDLTLSCDLKYQRILSQPFVHNSLVWQHLEFHWQPTPRMALEKTR